MQRNETPDDTVAFGGLHRRAEQQRAAQYQNDLKYKTDLSGWREGQRDKNTTNQ